MTTELRDKGKATTDMLGLCQAVTEISPLPIVGMEDAEHVISYVNPAFCKLVGRDKGQLAGTTFEDLPIIGEQCALTLDRVYRTGQPETLTVHERSGSFPLCSYAIWPVSSSSKPSPGIILQVIEETSIHQDAILMNEALMLGVIRQHELREATEEMNRQLQAEMTARKKAEEALVRSEKLASVGRMAAVIAHEINNPLAAVTDLLYLAERAEDVPTVREYLATADSELKRIAHITRQTLGFYREMAAPTTFLLCTLLDSVLDLLKSKIRARKAAIDVQCDHDLEITAVHGELRQVVSNLLVNSLDAVSEGGKVTVRASISRHPQSGAARIRLTVSDDGKGIDRMSLSQVFEPFFTTKGDTGNGLGLWVTRQLIEKHGGSISVRSQIRGNHCGTSFSIILPISGL